MDDTLGQSSTKRTLIILGAIIGIFAILMGIVTLTDNPKERIVNSPAGKVEIATADALQATIDLYRVQEGSYPYDLEDLFEEIPRTSNSPDYYLVLKGLDYSRRGDGEAYRFTYINAADELVTVEGNYEEDYH